MRLLLALLFVAPALGQQVWVVDRLNRPGTNFTDLPAAYAAAAPGDVLQLRSTGTAIPWILYTPPPLIDKGVKIVGEHATPTPIIGGNVYDKRERAWRIAAGATRARVAARS